MGPITITNTANVNVFMTVNEANAPAALGQATAKAATDTASKSIGTTVGKVGD